MLERKLVIYTKEEDEENREKAERFVVEKDFNLVDRILPSMISKINFKQFSFRQIEQLLLSIPTPWAKFFLYAKFLERIEKPEVEKFFLYDLFYNEISGILYTIALHPEKIKVQKTDIDYDSFIFEDLLFKKLFGEEKEIEILIFKDIPIAIYNREMFLVPKVVYHIKEKQSITVEVGNKLFCEHFLNPIGKLEEFKLIRFLKFIEFLLILKEYLEYGKQFERLLQNLKNEIEKNKVLYNEELREKINEEIESIRKIKNEGIGKEKSPLSNIIDIWKNLEEQVSDYTAQKVFGDEYSDKIIILPRSDMEKKSKILYPGYSYTNKSYMELLQKKDEIEKERGIKLIQIEKFFSNNLIKVGPNDYLLPIFYKILIEKVNDEKVIYKILEGMSVENNVIKTDYGLEDLNFQKKYNQVHSLEAGDLVISLYPWMENMDKYYLFLYISDSISKNLINKVEIYPNEIISDFKEITINDDNDIRGRIIIYELKKIPIFIGFDGRDTNSIYYINKNSIIKNTTTIDSITIGIDIGTTNTIIKYTDKEEQKDEYFEIFDFGISDGLLKIFIPSENIVLRDDKARQQLERKIAKIFMIGKDHKTYQDVFDKDKKGFFRTLLYTFSNDDKPFLSNHIYIGKEENNLRIISDIKWNRQYEFKKYIRQLAYFVNVFRKSKNVKDIKVVYSYPTSMYVELRDKISKYWEEALKDNQIEKFESFPESVAIFYSSGRQVADLGCAIDIGGGSTDFCVWSKNEIIGHFSIKYAGEDIIIRSIKEITNKDDREIRAKFDEGEFLSWLENEEREKATKLIGLSYICLFTTIGMYLSKQVRQEGESFYVGLLGNGSRFLKYVFDRKEDEVIERILGAIMKERKFEIHFSKKPKHEVVNGLLNPYIKEKVSKDEIDFFADIEGEKGEEIIKSFFDIVEETFKKAFEESLRIEYDNVYNKFASTMAGGYLRKVIDDDDIRKQLIQAGRPITLQFGEMIREEFVNILKGVKK